jgi:NADH-quinone oxidoreductase subunit M
MSPIHVSILALLVLLPAAAAGFTMLSASPRSARVIALGTTATALVVGLALGGTILLDNITALKGRSEIGESSLLSLGLDRISLPFLWVVLASGFVLVLSAPRREQTRAGLVILLTTESALVLLLLARDFRLFLLGWFVSLVPLLGLGSRRLVSRAGLVFAAAATIPLLAVLVVAGLSPSVDAFEMGHLGAGLLSPERSSTLLLLVTGAYVVRQGIFPFHSWVRASLQTNASLASTSFLVSFSGAYFMARAGRPLFAEVGADGLAWLPWLHSLTAVLGVLLALGGRSLRELVAGMSIAFSAFLGLGVSTAEALGAAGAAVQVLTYGLGLSGLRLCISSLEARVGTTNFDSLGGVILSAPALAAAFVVTGLASVGLPGFLGFVGEDILVHGLLEANPAVAALMVGSTALAAIAFLRAFTRVFLVRRAGGPVLLDLLPRERAGLAVIIAALLGFGLFPGVLF